MRTTFIQCAVAQLELLYELGDESALPALREAQNDREFEVAMQIRQAIERIESGKVGQGPVWRQMTQTTN